VGGGTSRHARAEARPALRRRRHRRGGLHRARRGDPPRGAGRSVQVFDTLHPGEGASTRNVGITSGDLGETNSRSSTYGTELSLWQHGTIDRELELMAM